MFKNIFTQERLFGTLISGDTMEIKDKLRILTDAAKYDVSCSSSGSTRKNKGGLGSAATSGICHSWSEDGRCISLLKILLTNKCIYQCEYCVNGRENSVERAEFTPQEVVNLVINFYKRNYIEGLFLSSGIIKSPDDTMLKLIEVAELLRHRENFNGYLHMKAIPGASDELVQKLGSLVDRMSVNIELPTQRSLDRLAPDKSYEKIFKPMNYASKSILQFNEDRKKYRHTPLFLPAGQSTQMIVGADREDDRTIIQRASMLYQNYDLKRVYYSGYVPVVNSPWTAGVKKVPLLREHRLYQADWLMRDYGFSASEILKKDNPNLDLTMDPKANWAVENIDLFPIEINRASYEELLRVPGFGKTYAARIVKARRFARLTFHDLEQMKISTKRAIHFITVNGKFKGSRFSSPGDLRTMIRRQEGTEGIQLSFLES